MEERLGEADEASFEALFLSDETRARAPSLDLEDEDVFGLEQVEQTAQIIETPEDQEVVEDTPARDQAPWVGRTEPTVSPAASGGRFAAVTPVAPDPPARTRSEKLMFGFLLLNAAALVGLFLGRGSAEENPGARNEGREGTGTAAATSAPVSAVPGVEIDAAEDGRSDANAPPESHPTQPAPLAETIAPASPGNAAQELVDRGAYQEAMELLEDELQRSSTMTLLQRRAALSTLAYCAGQLGQVDRGDYFRAAQANLAALAATPENAWAAAREAQRQGDHDAARRGFARLLLRQDQLIELWQGPECVGSAMVALGATHQDSAAERAKTSDEGDR